MAVLPTRHFIDWNKPALPETVEFLIQKYATADELDLSNVVLVFSGRRASRRMLELLHEKASVQWPAFLPPRMTTFQRFPELLYPQKNRLAEDFVQLLIWKKALSSIAAHQLTAALPSIPEDTAVPSWMSLCESLRKQHNELAEDGMDFEQVARELRRMGNQDEADRWDALRKIQTAYLNHMDRFELWDRQASRLLAVKQNECAAEFDIVLIGTVDINKIVKRMLLQVADSVTAIVHAPASEADRFDELGCLLPEHWVDTMLNIDLNQTRIANAPDEQATVVVHEIASMQGTRRADEITIGVADESLVPMLQQQLAGAGASGRWPVEMQVRNSRPWRLLDGIANHLASARDGQSPDFATLTDLVRHPDVYAKVDVDVQQAVKSRQREPADWLTELDKYVARHLQTSPGVLLGSKRRRQIVGTVLRSVDRLLQRLCPRLNFEESDVGRRKKPATKSQFPSLFEEPDDDSAIELTAQSIHQQLDKQRHLSEWIEGIQQLLLSVYDQQTLDPNSRADRAIVECCRSVTDVADMLQRVPVDVLPRCTALQAIQLVLNQVADLPVSPEVDDNAIDMLGWLELTMDDAPELILTGFNEGFIPQSMTSDVFLPNSFRSRLGLRDNKRRYARDAYALTVLLQSRDNVVFVCGRRDRKGNPLMPSRLWFAADEVSLPQRVQQFYDNESSALTAYNTNSSESDFEPQIQRTSGFVVPPPCKIPAAPAEISVTAFKEYLYCPYRYFLKRELRLKTIDDETLELEAAAFGSLIHDVLKAFGQADVSEALRPEPIEDFLLRTLTHLANQRFGRIRSATVSVQLQMMKNRLAAFAIWQADNAKDGWRIRHTEEDLKYHDFRDSFGRPIVLAGRVDRIDQHINTGAWRVLDYKTSERAEEPNKTHKHKTHGWVDLQLPLYRLLVRSLGINTDVSLGYIHLPGNLSHVGSSMATWTESDLKEAEETARQVASNIYDLKIDRIAAPNERRFTEFAGICQDTVVDQQVDWLDTENPLWRS